jgi:hypothetical protein
MAAAPVDLARLESAGFASHAACDDMIDAAHIRRAPLTKGDDVDSIGRARGAEDKTEVGLALNAGGKRTASPGAQVVFEWTTEGRRRLERPEDFPCRGFDRSREQRIIVKRPSQIRQIVRDERLYHPDRRLGEDAVEDFLRVGRGQACDRRFSETMRSYS